MLCGWILEKEEEEEEEEQEGPLVGEASWRAVVTLARSALGCLLKT